MCIMKAQADPRQSRAPRRQPGGLPCLAPSSSPCSQPPQTRQSSWLAFGTRGNSVLSAPRGSCASARWRTWATTPPPSPSAAGRRRLCWKHRPHRRSGHTLSTGSRPTPTSSNAQGRALSWFGQRCTDTRAADGDAAPRGMGALCVQHRWAGDGNYHKYKCGASGAQPPFPFPFGALQVRTTATPSGLPEARVCPPRRAAPRRAAPRLAAARAAGAGSLAPGGPGPPL